MSLDKLHTKLETGLVKKTVELRFTDYSINKFKPDYKNAKNKYYPIIDSGIKGLKLLCVKSSGNKFLTQQYWFNGKSDYWTVGQFRKDIFGIKECRTKVVAIMEDHTDDNGLWIKSPKITAKQIKQRISKAELENRQLITITTAIERYCKAGFPKMNVKLTLW